MKDNPFFKTISVFFQLAVWVCLILAINQRNSNKTDKYLSLTFFILTYIIYIAIQFCSKVGKYLCTRTTKVGIFEKLGKYYSTYPVIKFFCECYHYEMREIRHVSRRGRYRMPSKVKVKSYKETYLFPYYSERDVSGLFYLECNSPEKKYYIQLDIDTEINFADAISYMDYQAEKDSFWRRNVFKDKYFNFQETRYIPGLEKENLVRIGDTDPCCASFFIYFIFIILTLGEFYKLYFNSLCVEQTYKIRKLVSTRYDLGVVFYWRWLYLCDECDERLINRFIMILFRGLM